MPFPYRAPTSAAPSSIKGLARLAAGWEHTQKPGGATGGTGAQESSGVGEKEGAILLQPPLLSWFLRSPRGAGFWSGAPDAFWALAAAIGHVAAVRDTRDGDHATGFISGLALRLKPSCARR